MAVKVKVVTLKGRPYAVRWFDPAVGTERQQSLGTLDRAEAERLAKLHAERIGQAKPVELLTWLEFRERFEAERMPAMSAGTRGTYGFTFKLFEKALGPLQLAAVNAAVLSQFQAWLRTRGCKEITIQKHMRQMRAALRWAYELELIDRMPAVPKPVRGSIPKKMKGRPLTDAEFASFLAAVPSVVPEEQVAAWSFFAKGLWFQGLRLGDALNLSWDQEHQHRVDLARVLIWIRGNLEKGKRDRMHPMAPEFADLLQVVPEPQRRGAVFVLPGRSACWVSRIGTAIGTKAAIVVSDNAGTGKPKHASFHDLRRSCALRWAEHLPPQDLMEFMRHSSLQVTMDYYVGARAMQVASRMRAVQNAKTGVVSVDESGQDTRTTEGQKREPRNASC